MSAKIEIVLPWQTDNFRQAWELWKQYKAEQFRFKYKSPISEQSALKGLQRKAGNDEGKAIAIIEQSMENGWRGLFEIKTNTHGQTQTNGLTDAEIRFLSDTAELGSSSHQDH